ncbi:type II secretory pathway, component PulF [Desulfosporosinus orientis DSM 765]|uniref:Type II secretory pathway, component PulF n=1 Tax=Desulfosporosinus orientis (strain ATCC 19365 / DSM 765 / NCIMB 8382 / VKM B-1628 / Singapore I) TaxID=768706 RepID=G7W5L8_DESOD|nr:type II secretion system F family protein [Desulfosporosinus orientis]AET66665.1 type II secretory pathway, component PulF [Desulfosporosinus orientis DSM 765]
MQFRYKVVDDKLSLRTGIVEAIDLESARMFIINNNWQIIMLKEVKKIDSFFHKRFEGRIKAESISSFCSQLAMIIRSGASMIRGLEIMQSQINAPRFKEVVSTLYVEVSRGNSLAQAMRSCQGSLPELLINLVSVGEESGNLDSVLISMAAYYDRENFIRKKMSSAAIYPVILIVVLIGLLILFMNFILPEITGMLAENGQSLPVITQLMVNTTEFIKDNFIFLLLGCIGIVLFFFRLIKIPQYRYVFDSLMLRTPLFGKNIKNVIISRFSRTLALFLHSSIPIISIFDSMESILGNEVPRRAIIKAKERIINGETLNSAFGQEPFFDPLVIQMMAIGEETGRLEELMEEVSDHYDRLVEIGISRMVALVEPAFTVLIGVLAGGMIISIALPIFSMTSGLSR